MKKSWLQSVLAMSAVMMSFQPLTAQTKTISHNLTLSNSVESTDAKGRVIVVSNVAGDLQGVLTLAMTMNPDGSVKTGEWAFSVSFTQFGAVTPGGDGDASEVLVQLGVLKGTVLGGTSFHTSTGAVSDLSGIHLSLTGGTVQYAGKNVGSGSVTETHVNQQGAARGSLSLTF